MRALRIAAYAALLALPTLASVFVDQSKITAVLRNDSTVITIPVANYGQQPVKGTVSLEWLNPKDETEGEVHRDVTIPPGRSSLDIPFHTASATVWTRLRYNITPSVADAREFPPASGTVALPRIASYAFEMTFTHVPTLQRGKRVAVHAETAHPFTRQPLDPVWKAVLEIDDLEIAPIKATRLAAGTMEFLFDIPAGDDDSDNDAKVHIQATLGDFSAEGTVFFQIPDNISARLQSDKPIYQPGQTMHLRAIALDPLGHAAPGAKISLRIDDEDGERVHTADLEASNFGIVHDDWQIPDSASAGVYRITIGRGDNEDRLAFHTVRVSRYELPMFTVTARPDRSVYLPDQQPRVTITGTYLFGKPVPKGKVRIVRMDDDEWRKSPTRKIENDADVVAKGDAGDDGVFTVALPVDDERDFNEHQFFRDLHYAAFYTDPSSNRTEQRRFDIRLTREALHVYLFEGSSGRPDFITTSYADGRPVSATVEITGAKGQSVVRTNRYGVARWTDGVGAGNIKVRAADAQGATGTSEVFWRRDRGPLQLTASRILHRTGDSVTLHLKSTDPSVTQAVVHAVAGNRLVASRAVVLAGGVADVTFPYQPEFRRLVTFAAMTMNRRAQQAVIFPDASDLHVAATTARASYRPGETAPLTVRVSNAAGAPVDAALGVAIVDQAVLERARTDSEFGQRRWFDCAWCDSEDNASIGGVQLSGLFTLKPASINPELDTVAEALVLGAQADLSPETIGDITTTPGFAGIPRQRVLVTNALDRYWTDHLVFPRDQPTFMTAVSEVRNLEDPWGRPYHVEFDVQDTNYVIRLRSDGPDQEPGTRDDFIAATFEKPFFRVYELLIRDILSKAGDFPANEEQFVALLREHGINFLGLKDPWGKPYRVNVTTFGASRGIVVESSLIERYSVVAYFQGGYFTRESAAIAKAVAAGSPKTLDDFYRLLTRAGINLDAYRDTWNHPYYVTLETTARFESRRDFTTVRTFGQPAFSRDTVTPVTRRYARFAVVSPGPDGAEKTKDDFSVAAFDVLLSEESAEAARAPAPSPSQRGSASITGSVADATGATVPHASVRLIGAFELDTVADDNGEFRFASLPVGTYTIRVSMAGFRVYELRKVGVSRDGETVRVSIVLEVGTVSEAVEVSAAATTLQTSSASAMPLQMSQGMVSRNDVFRRPTSTPPVRDYFPETLLWLPEVLTGPTGQARIPVKLAGNVTTWKVALIASALDGRIAEADTDLRAFQPFFLDFNPPLVLTEGDRVDMPVAVRNYQDRPQPVGLELAANDWSTVEGDRSRRLNVEANSSANISFPVTARRSLDKAPQRLSANAGKERDAIEKSLRVHPDGQQVTRTFGDLAFGSATFPLDIPADAITGGTRGELRLYPNFTSLLLESADAILLTPHGCAEQTVSTGYANLIAWRFARAAGIRDPRVEKRALDNVRLAVEGLETFARADGGISYWPGNTAHAGVTAYALHFLADASTFVKVEPERMDTIVKWLAKNRTKDGAWRPLYDNDKSSLLLTASVLRGLAAARKAGVKIDDALLAGGYHHLATFIDQIDEPYMLAGFILATIDSGDTSLLGDAVDRLVALARTERGGEYWDLRSNTPFYGWGTAGRYETTGLAVSALSAWRATQKNADPAIEKHIRAGLVFLLRGRGSNYFWYSTQATVQSMRAIADASAAIGSFAHQDREVEIRSGNRVVRKVAIPTDPKATDPIYVDLSAALAPGTNNITVAGGSSLLLQFTATHWLPWDRTMPRTSAELRLSVEHSTTGGHAGEAVRCKVKAERVGFRGYGMVIAEIGLPPAAEVDRASLEDEMEHGSLDRYEIQPDRVILYLWPKAGGASVSFLLTPRIPMAAKSAPSLLYDYYNPEALTELAPSRWTISGSPSGN